MSNQLKQFVRDHRAEFDSEEPAPQLWNKINQQLEPPTRKGFLRSLSWMQWGIAAAVLVLLGVGTVFILSRDGTKQAPPLANTTPPDSATADIINDINPAYAKEVYHFTQLIELKQAELKQVEKDDPVLYKKFVIDIDKLDSSYNALKQQLPSNPNREQLLAAMIQNLQLQEDILNQQLQIIQQIKQSKKSTHETPGKSI